MEAFAAQLIENTKWWIRLRLAFKPFLTHLSIDGFVLYKKLDQVLYVYAHGHFVNDNDHRQTEKWDGGANTPWSN